MNTAQVIDSSKVSDHHAIIPTMNIKGLDVQSLPAGERETLLLLAIRLLVAIGDTHRYSETVITAKCSESVFTAKGKTVTQDGFKAVQMLYKGEQDKEEKDQVLPSIDQGDVFTPRRKSRRVKPHRPNPLQTIPYYPQWKMPTKPKPMPSIKALALRQREQAFWKS